MFEIGTKGKLKKAFIASVMAGSLLQTGAIASAEGRLAEPIAQATNLAAASYKDFDAKAGWAPAMDWAISEGIVSGYQNQKHPSDPKKGVSNWLNPYGPLTEYQMLTILLRHKEADSLKQVKASTTNAELSQNYAFAEYKLAKSLGMVTRGSTTNAALASKQVTRGQWARALVSYIYKQPVTLEEAIEFLYANKLMIGMNPEKGQTFENFGRLQHLTRAQLVVVLERYSKLGEDFENTLYPSYDDVSYESPENYSDLYSYYDFYNFYNHENNEAEAELEEMRLEQPDFQTKEEAEANMVRITVPVWNVDKKGNKVASTATLTVYKELTEPFKAAFQDIFNGEEKFPMKDVGSFSWRSNVNSEHRDGTAVDINANENIHALVDEEGNVTKIFSGSFWKPYENQYSITEDGDVVRAFKKHGFTWGGDAWPGSVDYMHFSYFGT